MRCAITSTLFALSMLAVAAACAVEDAEPQPLDNRVELPAEDEDHVLFVAEEIVIEPGEDKMYCHHLVVEEDMALNEVEMLQGEYGHHSVILSTSAPQPPGTIEDCSDGTASERLSALLLPVPNVAENTAFFLEAGTAVVIQSHYVNASDEPILVRDAVRARRVPIDAVDTWMATFITTDLTFAVPIDAQVEATFDCTFDENVDLLQIGGHMHEMGISFELHHGPTVEELAPLYIVDDWIPEFRDSPPMNLYGTAPYAITAGSVLRTTCRWDNRTGEVLGFPDEMCAGFGVISGTKERYECRIK